jgi:hypothetical protein
LTNPVVAAHVHPSLPSSRLLGPRCGDPSSSIVLVLLLRSHRGVPGFAEFKVPHRGNLSRMWGATPSVSISKLEPLVRAMFCAPGRNRTYDRQIRRLLLYPLSYGGRKTPSLDSTAGLGSL